MLWSRIAMTLPLVALAWGCVEQEPDRPTEEDKRIIAQNILSKVPEMKHKVNADLEGKVTYLGLDVDRDVIRPNEQFTVTHFWKVHKAVDGWRLFVHLNGPNKSGFINADHNPIGGRYPVSNWKAGEVIRDEHKITLPTDWKQPQVSIFTGLWKGQLRMKIKGPQDGENRVLAVTLPVQVGAVAVPKPKRLVAFKTAKPVKLDGVLDDEAWTKTPSSGPFVNTLDGKAVPVSTEAQVAWDEKHLYVAFRCADDDIWSSFKARDEKLWTQEAVEVFIDANGDKKDYIELQVNPHGTIFDSFLPEYRKNQNDWNGGVKAAVKVEGTADKRDDKDKAWTVEMAIPWADLNGRSKAALELPPKPGAVMRVNFFRMDQPKDKPQVASGWSPPMIGDFHALDRFGDLVFADVDGKLPEAAPPAEPAKAPEPKAAAPAPPAPGPNPAAAGKVVEIEGLKRHILRERVMPLPVREPPKKAAQP